MSRRSTVALLLAAGALAVKVARLRRRAALTRVRPLEVPPVPSAPPAAHDDLTPAAARSEAPARAGTAAERPRSRRRVARRVALTLAVLGVAGAAGSAGMYSAFTATTSNTGDSYVSGTVVIGDNDAGSALTSLSNAKPGDTSTGCIKVTYTGSLAANVHLYGSVSGSLDQYLTLTVTRGTQSSPSFPSCTSFSADSTNYIGAGAGVIYSGNLSAFPTDWTSGIVDPPSGGAATWTNGTSHSYMFVVTVQDSNSAQGLNGTASFTWEARNT